MYIASEPTNVNVVIATSHLNIATDAQMQITQGDYK